MSLIITSSSNTYSEDDKMTLFFGNIMEGGCTDNRFLKNTHFYEKSWVKLLFI